MAASLPAREISRVVIAIDSATPSLAALEAGVGLAGAVGAALQGLYFDNVDLLRLGALPFAVELSALTGTRRELSSRHVERALRLEAARQEKLLAASAARTRVPWTFAVARGRRLTAAIADDAELVVLAPRGRGPREFPRLAPPGPIAAMFGTSDAATRGLTATARLAATLAREMLILVPDGQSRSAQAPGEQARAWLAREGLAGRVVTLLPERAALVAVVRAQRSTMLALPASTLAAWSMDMDTLLAALTCPLVLTR